MQTEIILPVRDYNLAATLDSGQVFRWRQVGNSWHGIVGSHFVRLTHRENAIHAETAAPVANWDWLRHFLQSDLDLAAVIKTFPDDQPMRHAVAACRGLRLLRQDPWECLASFILSSTKQIVQIRQIVGHLCERFGEPLPIRSAGLRPGEFPQGHSNTPVQRPALQGFGFPSPQRIAAASDAELRDCKMGFRAPSLLAAANHIANGHLNLDKLRTFDYLAARTELMKLRGVGAKIADCVLLFAYGFDSAFPVDVWIERALQELYFPRRRANEKRLRKFADTHFGPHAGYAQQYLFHYMRTRKV